MTMRAMYCKSSIFPPEDNWLIFTAFICYKYVVKVIKMYITFYTLHLKCLGSIISTLIIIMIIIRIRIIIIIIIIIIVVVVVVVIIVVVVFIVIAIVKVIILLFILLV